MRRFVLTGAPGAGKTTLIRHFEELGRFVVEEAATDIIRISQANGVKEPWADPSFIEDILELQSERQMSALKQETELQFFDRGPLDTLALCRFLEHPISPGLLTKILRVQEAGRFENEVFFLDNLGFCEPSSARKISFEEACRFETVHKEVYSEFGYRFCNVPPLSVPLRAMFILERVQETSLQTPSSAFREKYLSLSCV